MQPEGMVHALELVHEMLDPGGLLIDIHPTEKKPTIEVMSGEQYKLAGYLEESDDFEEYIQAEAALLGAVIKRQFRLERRESFLFRTIGVDIDELQAYLSENWKDAILKMEVITRARQLIRVQAEDKRVVLTEQITISLLRPLQEVISDRKR